MARIKRVIYCCIFLLTALLPKVSAQGFYVTTGQSLIKISFSGTGCVSTGVNSCSGVSLSVALYRDTLYYNRDNTLYRAILKNKSFINCTVIDTIARGANSLTVDSTGVLYYAAGKQLYKIDPHAANQVFLGNLPFSSAGDLVFYNHVLYMAAREGIAEINTADPSKSSLIIPISNSTIWGLATLAVDCNKNGIYAFVNKGQQTDLVEIDLVNNTIAATVCTLPYGVNDAASLVEDGRFFGIVIDEMIAKPQCNNPGKAELQINCEAGLVPYTFILNNTIQNSTGNFQNLNGGTYAIKITTPGGCVKDTIIMIPSYDWQPARLLSFKEEPNCMQPGKIWFSTQPSSGIYNIIYNKDTFPASHIFSELPYGDHHFMLTNTYGCLLDSADISFLQKESCDTIFFPTAFTPNNDGKNDLFKGSYNYGLKAYRLMIYNRWGQLVYATRDQKKGWNGSFNGKLQPTQVYIWIADYTTNTGHVKTQKGTVTLIR